LSQREVLAGRYRIEQELGRGGMAKVFKGTDTVLGREVAIKILAPQFAEDPSFVDRFRREAQAAARLNHPNLVSVYDTGSDDGMHFIVMEYVEAKTLADYLAGGSRIMPERAIELAEAVCDALTVAHAQGVIHRDIKPGNIMVTRAGEVKVTDFGIARLTSSAETIAQTAAVLGTASYLSPEQAQGQQVDVRTDLYSLGVVLYEMVAGRPPFIGGSAFAVASQHVHEQPVPASKLNPDVTPALDAVIMRALAKNPVNRYGSAQEFRADLERVRAGLPVEATPLLPSNATTQVIDRSRQTAVLPPQPAAPSRRGPSWTTIAIAVLVLAVLGGGLYLLASALLKNPTPGAPKVPVPYVVGDTLKDATDKLTAAGLKVAQPIRRVDDPTGTPGTVLSQDPAADTPVAKGALVTLTVVKGPGAVSIPLGLTGQPADQVDAQLTTLGLVVTRTPESSDTIAVASVTRTDPTEGTPVTVGSPVTIFVSTGPGTVSVPDVTCFSYGQAKKTLADKQLGIEIAGELPPNLLCPNGTKVVQQDPAANTPASPGTVVQVWLAGTESPSPTGSPTPSPT
jgi:eukaryotic-like serine/threonine-protein kinase